MRQMYHQAWTTRDGAPSNIEEIAEGPDGFLWLATDDGLYRFDGVSFERYATPGRLGLPSNYVFRISVTRDGSLWLSYFNGGLSRIKDRELKNFNAGDGLLGGQINTVVEDLDGSFWIAGPQGLQILRGTTFTNVGSEHGLPVGAVEAAAMDTEGNLWISRAHDVLTLVRGATRFVVSIANLTEPDQLKAAKIGIWRWQTNGPVTQWRVVGGHPAQTRVLDVDQARSIAEPGDGTVWIGTKHGIQRTSTDSDGKQNTPVKPLERFSDRDGLTADDTFSSVVDREGSVWIASGRGLDRFRPVPFTSIEVGSGAPVQLAHGKPDERMVIATDHLIEIGSNDPVSLSSPFDGTWARSLFRSDDGSLWVGAVGQLYRYAEGKLLPQSLPPDLGPRTTVLAIAEDENHRVWISAGNGYGLYRFDGKSWLPRGGYAALPNETATFVERDHSGALWFGFRNDHLARIHEGQLINFGTADGLHLGDLKVFTEQDGVIWIGGDRGVVVRNGSIFYPLMLAGGAVLRGVTGLAFAPDGALWVNQLSSVLRIPKSELDTDLVAAGRRANYRSFEYRDGLQGIPHSVLGLGSAQMAANGKLYVATREFLQWIDPLHLPHNEYAPQVWIKGVQADGKTDLSPVAVLSTKPNVTAVQIDYTASSLLIPDRVAFRYQLKGYDKTWVEAGARRQAFYSKLPPGTYEFRVIASNDSGVWNNSGASVGLLVPPTFIQTIWFKALCLLGIAIAVWLIYGARVRQLSGQLQARLYARASERERIARDLHDTFFQGIQGLFLKIHSATQMLSKDDPIRPLFEDALSKSDQLMDEGRELVLDLRSPEGERKDLAALLHDAVKELSAGSTAAFQVIVNGEPRPLLPGVSDEIHRLGREALSNAFRHSEAQVIEAEINYDPRELRVCFRDNGIGIDAEILRRGGRENHWGLPGMRERARSMGAHMEIWSARNTGTEIAIRIPADLAYSGQQTRSRLRWLKALYQRAENAHE
jgi:signal transduction histidine kinase/ligand-binding sensor domain-containing protein